MASHIKTELSPSPPLLTAFESAAPRRCFLLSLCVGLVWIALGAGDWLKRFEHFGWHKGFVIQPASTHTQAKSSASTVVTNAPRRGGDLSNLIGIANVSASFEEEREGATNRWDEDGFRNAAVEAADFPVVVVGDSYAATGPRFEDTLAAQLSARLGVSVYNHAAEGRGTFWAAARFFASERFRGHEPRVLVWPLIEREIAGEYFAGGYFQIVSAGRVSSNAVATGARLDWNQLKPASLRRSLPNTSAISLLAGRQWNRVRYALFGQVNPYVVPSVSDVGGGPMLFYSEGIRAHRWTDGQRMLPVVVRALRDINALASQRGIKILFVLVPDKERVYSAALPAHIRDSVRPSFLPDVERAVREAGVALFNLDGAFRSHAEAGGGLLYWRDDTHWNPAGVALAAEVIAPEVRALLEGARQKSGGR